MKSNRYSIISLALIIVALVYALIRAKEIFYVHDELVSKWAYMIDWNFLPYQGYIDANNHFLNSLLGGAFIRLFNSDHIMVVRLSSLIGLIIYGLAAFSLKRHFSSPLAHLFLLAALLFSPYLIEFFSLARGYGLSWAFLLLSISFLMRYYRKSEYSSLTLSAFCLLIASYANLALITLSAFGYALLLLKAYRKPIQILLCIPFIGALSYLVQYAFDLQASGKLYLGEASSFLNTTLLPLLEFNFNSSNVLLLSLVLFCGIFLILWLPFKLVQYQSIIPNYKLIPHAFFAVAVFSIFLLNAVFEVRFPMHRAAAHLILLFIISLFFTLDQMQLKKGAALISMLLLINFGIQANFTHAREWDYEHFDRKLLEKIPLVENGIPPTTGGRFWQIDNEMARVYDYPMRAMQDMSKVKDSLQDYLVVLPSLNPRIHQSHELIYQDSISTLSLFKRKGKLNKVLDSSFSIKMEMSAETEFYEFYKLINTGPVIIQTEGEFQGVDIYRDFMLIFSASEPDSDEKLYYGGIGPVSSTKIEMDGSIDFNFSYLIEGKNRPYQLSYYVWKRDGESLKGNFNLRIFKVQVPIQP